MSQEPDEGPPAEPVVVSAETATPPSTSAIVWAWCAVALALPMYGSAWLLAACCGLLWRGLLAGWRDMRTFTSSEDAVNG